MILGGFDEGVGPSLYFIDYLASMQKIDKGAHGYAGFFCHGLLDAGWKPNMSVEEGLVLMRTCTAELKTRFMMNMPNWMVKVVDKDGVREVSIGA